MNCAGTLRHPVVFERADIVGGNARTEEFHGYRFDIGGHRFFTKIPEVRRIWEDVLQREIPACAQVVAHLLQRQVFLLPAQTRQCGPRPRPLEQHPHCHQFPALFSVPLSGGGQSREVGQQPIWQAPLQDLLQDLHGESLGNALHQHPGRMGCSTDQRIVPAHRCAKRSVRRSAEKESRPSSRNSGIRSAAPE